jgi:hypothetical protein
MKFSTLVLLSWEIAFFLRDYHISLSVALFSREA